MTEPETNHEGAASDPSLFEALRLRNLGWLLRAIGACAVLATALGVIVAPGMHGNASDAIVEGWDRAAAVFGYAMAILVSAGLLTAASELVGTRHAESASGAAVVGGGGLVVVLLVVAVVRARAIPDAPLPAEMTIGLAVVAAMVASTAAWRAMAGPHTRALAIVIALLAFAALVRVGAWELAAIAGERANPALYSVSRGVATAATVCEALAQLAAALWIGTRGRAGLALTTLAAVGAFAVTWGAAAGGHGDAPRWAAVLHSALAGAASLPAPYGLSAAQSFLIASSVLLGAGALLLVGQPAAIVAALALALVSRGSFDAPLRAVAIAGAAMWTLTAALDERLLWATLTATRERASTRPPASPTSNAP